ncbi:MAG: hypothetical protein SGBAC_011382 [Bacillariaceae sp.]
MTDCHTISSVHSLNSDLSNMNPAENSSDSAHVTPSIVNNFEGDEKKRNDEEMVSPPLSSAPHTYMVKQPIDAALAPRASGATQVQSNQSKDMTLQLGHNSLLENGTLDSDSIYTNNDKEKEVSDKNCSTVISSTNDAEMKGDAVSFNTPSAAPSVALSIDEVGSYMSVEVIEPSAYDGTPKIGHGHKTTSEFEPIVQVVEHNDAQMPDMFLPEMNHQQPSHHARQFSNEVPTQEIIRQLSNVVPKEAGMTPPNMVVVEGESNKKPNPISAGSAASTDGSLYTDGHDGSTLTKDTFLKQQDYNYMEEEKQAYSIIDPEAPQQEATQDYDAYYDPNAYSAFGISTQDEPSIGHSTITSLTKDTGILRTEQPDDLPISRGIMTGEDVSYLSPPRIDYRLATNKPGTPSTLESGGMVNDKEYSSGGHYSNNKGRGEEPRTMWAFLQNATRDPTVQCLISLACIFAVLLFFLVAVIIVLTSDDIQI